VDIKAKERRAKRKLNQEKSDFAGSVRQSRLFAAGSRRTVTTNREGASGAVTESNPTIRVLGEAA
jgi:hypothetical protein